MAKTNPADSSGPGRREARERAIALCYEAEAKSLTPVEILESLPAAPMAYTSALVTGFTEKAEEVDAVIETHSQGWSLRRMPAMDRAILRVGSYELAFREDVPMAVIIDEAVELAKDYSTEKSGRFINGVLAAVAAAVRPA